MPNRLHDLLIGGFLIAASIVLVPGGHAFAQSSGGNDIDRVLREMDQVERQRARSARDQRKLEEREEALRREVNSLRQLQIVSARETQDLEVALSSLDQELQRLLQTEKQRREELATKRGQLIGLVGALQRLSRRPPQALIAGPATAVETVRGAMLLRVAVPQIESQAADLRKEIAGLATLRTRIQEQRAVQDQTSSALDGKRQELASLIAARERLLRETEQERKAAARRTLGLARKAKNLQGLFDHLEEERQAEIRRQQDIARARAEQERRDREAARAEAREKAERQVAATPGPAKPSFSEPDKPDIKPPTVAKPEIIKDSGKITRPDTIRRMPRGGRVLTMPAVGRILRRFGDKDDVGVRAKGITIATRAGAQVVAPYDGQVVFAGPFRGYGPMVIVEHRGGYHSMLAGLSRIDATVGSWVVEGEPVGIMGDAAQDSRELYVELRRRSQPIDPWPRIASR